MAHKETQTQATLTMVYDANCALCSRAADVVRRGAGVRTVPCQSEEGQQRLRASGIDPSDPQSFLVEVAGIRYLHSTAILLLMRRMTWPWPLFARLVSLLPLTLRDRLYGVLARNRYRWFGRVDCQACRSSAGVRT